MWLTAIKNEDKCELNESLTRVDDIKAQSFIFYLWLPQQHHKTAKVVWQKKSAALRVIVEIQTENDFILLAYFAVGQEWCETKIYEIF